MTTDKKEILLVEDDPRSLYAFGAVLQARNFEVVACDSAESALPHTGNHYSAAIIDVRLPKMQGTELALQLRQNNPKIKIIFVTAYDGVEDIRSKVPECAVLLKPIDMDTLLRLL